MQGVGHGDKQRGTRKQVLGTSHLATDSTNTETKWLWSVLANTELENGGTRLKCLGNIR